MCPGEKKEPISNSYTFAEVNKLAESDKKNVYIIIDSCVYKVTDWLPRHPGGEDVIRNLSGRDASLIFRSYHPKSSYLYLSKYKIGNLIGQRKSDFALAYEDFMDDIYNSDLMNTDFAWFFMKTMVSLSLLAIAVSLYLVGSWYNNITVQLFGGFMLGVFFQQTAFLGHDTGHNGITHDRFRDTMYGFLVGPLLTGISIGWWKDSHNTHHSVPNVVQHDPDIQHLPVFAVTPKYFESIYSFYHKRVMAFDAVARFFVSYQHYLFYPIMALARFNLYAQSIIYILVKKCEYKKTEMVATAVFWTWLILLHSQCSSVPVAFACLLLSHAVAGLLHVQICLSHFPMTVYDEVQYGEDSHGFFETQIATTLDVDCPKWLDWFHGGLQFQTAHHLFPRMPRHNLRKLQTRLLKFCAQHGKPYYMFTFVEANKKLLKGLQLTAEAAKDPSKAFNFSDSMLWEGLCAQG